MGRKCDQVRFQAVSRLAYVTRGFRRATAPLRSLPDVLIVGAMRCGTTALFNWLAEHPQVTPPTRKEIHFLDFHFERGVNWYLAFFPLRGARVTMDASPSYMNHPATADRAARLMPDARVIAVLREPAERAWSQYRLRREQGNETRDFRTAIEFELNSDLPPMRAYDVSAHIPYLTAGLYAAQLTPWIEQFGRESILVLDSQRLFTQSDSTLRAVQRFIAIDEVSTPFRQVNSAPPASPPLDLMQRMVEYFREPNRELAELFGPVFSWIEHDSHH